MFSNIFKTLTNMTAASDDFSVGGDLTVDDNIELGHASDTTIARASSGDITIEGNAVYRAGGTDVPVADGGTGASSLTDNAVLTGTGTSAITAESNLTFDGTDLTIASTGKLILGGGAHSYIYEASDDIVQIVVGGDKMISFDEANHYIYFGDTSGPNSIPVGFTQSVVSFNNSDTVVYFNLTGQKQYVELTDNVTNITSKMPPISASFTLVVKQDSTGGRVVTNWKVKDSGNNDAAGSATVLWPGGSAPTLSTGANDIDIINFYWDATNEKLFGTAALDFS
jgi:hypothetical protein